MSLNIGFYGKYLQQTYPWSSVRIYANHHELQLRLKWPDQGCYQIRWTEEAVKDEVYRLLVRNGRDFKEFLPYLKEQND